MKLMNFSFIFALIFMMGSLDLIHTEPYPKLNLEKPFLNEARKLSPKCEGCIRIIYGSDATFSYKGSSSPTITMAGVNIGYEERAVTDGTIIDIKGIAFSNEIIYFFKNYIGDYNKIKLIDLSYKMDNTPNLNINGLFSGCEELIIANLSHITVRNPIASYVGMFENCKKLKILDISGITFKDSTNTFALSSSLAYLEGAQLPNLVINEIKNNIENLTVCHGDTGYSTLSITKKNYKYACCNFEEDENGKCESDNYMIIYFKEKVSSFSIDFDFLFDNVSLILTEEEGYTKWAFYQKNYNFGKKTEFIIIYFSKILESLKGFSFNQESIKTVDFSHFDFSKFESTQNMFLGSSIETIILSNINAPQLTNMDSMFQDSSILSVNLSNFTAPNVNSMNNIFKGCNDLKVLDISGFVFDGEVSSNSLFEELPSLLYLNIKDVTFQDNIRTQFQNLLTSKSGMTVCQNDQVLNKTENKNPKNDYRCCNFILEGETCESFNFIKAIYKLDYGKEVEFDPEYGEGETEIYFIPIEYQGFGNQRSEQILYIEKGDKYFNPKAKFSIDGDYYVEIKIHFSQGFVDLKNMFSFEIDTNVKYIVSIDFSNFSSLITDMSKLFYECEKLTSVDFSNVNTSSVTNMIRCLLIVVN